jgi:hypothetical protein
MVMQIENHKYLPMHRILDAAPEVVNPGIEI